MKRVYAFIGSILMIFCTAFCAPASCAEFSPARKVQSVSLFLPNNEQVNIEADFIHQFDNGAKMLCSRVQILEKSNNVISTQKEAFYTDSNNNLIWKITLQASFSYNGTTSSCIAAYSYSTVYSGNWSEDSNTTVPSANTAVAHVEMVRKVLFIIVERQNVVLTLSCDKDGNIT